MSEEMMNPSALEASPADDHAHGDVTVLFGRTLNMPIYTVVFVALGFLTLFSMLIAEIIPGDIKIPVLLALSATKVMLVVLFYMHLRDDSRLFAVALAVPTGIAIIATLFLMSGNPALYAY